MATKYTRESRETPASRLAERLEARRQTRPAGPFSFRAGGAGLFLSLGAVIFALMLFQTAVDRMLAESPAPRTAVGTVSAKAPADPEDAGSRPLLQLTFAMEDGAIREVWTPTDPESWDIVDEGDQLEVDYTIDWRTGSLQVQRLRAVSTDAADSSAEPGMEADGELE